jgi:hypothetical protein
VPDSTTEIRIITLDGIVAPFLRVYGSRGSEITRPGVTHRGPALLLVTVGMSDSFVGGITGEVTGPFRR